jgi:hypothetical protein
MWHLDRLGETQREAQLARLRTSIMLPMREQAAQRPIYEVIKKGGKQPPKAPAPPKSQANPPKPPPSGKYSR